MSVSFRSNLPPTQSMNLHVRPERVSASQNSERATHPQCMNWVIETLLGEKTEFNLEEYQAAFYNQTKVTFPCNRNVLCIPCDLITACHACTGSICCGIRPTLYDSCAPSLLPPYIIGMDNDLCCDEPTSCCDYPSQEFRK